MNEPIKILNSYEETKRKYPDYWDLEDIKGIENEKEKKKIVKYI